MILFKHVLLFAVFTTISVSAVAQTTPTPRPIPQYDEYYTIDEKSVYDDATKTTSISFSEFSAPLSPKNFFSAAKTLVINLLKLTFHNERRPTPEEHYIRKLHFGRWINDPTDDTCMNTRAKVLVRDSEDLVTFRNGKTCVVDSGKWTDPYSNKELTMAREIQVDHMVPLKHAYLAGAYEWDYKTRCLYANYQGYHNHLVPATVRENTSKGDRAPDKYLPSNESYRCQYIKDWLAIKLIWRLNLTADEVQTIQDVVEHYNCNLDNFQVRKRDLKDQREFITDNLEYCMLNKR